MDGLCSLPSLPAETADVEAAFRPDIGRSYDHYIASGLYDSRYPKPNRRVLRQALQMLPAGGTFLDFGAGTGRYTLPLLALSGANGVAYDICRVACSTLTSRARDYVAAGRLKIVDGPMGAIRPIADRPFDLALLAFGVLGHIAGREERLSVLRAVRDMLHPNGRILLGLPNARRRFLAEQVAARPLIRNGELEPGDIFYHRTTGADRIELFYHLYTAAEARRDLAEAGFRVDRIGPESVLPESEAVRRRATGMLDDVLSGLVPAWLAYGLLIAARPAGGELR